MGNLGSTAVQELTLAVLMDKTNDLYRRMIGTMERVNRLAEEVCGHSPSMPPSPSTANVAPPPNGFLAREDATLNAAHAKLDEIDNCVNFLQGKVGSEQAEKLAMPTQGRGSPGAMYT